MAHRQYVSKTEFLLILLVTLSCEVRGIVESYAVQAGDSVMVAVFLPYSLIVQNLNAEDPGRGIHIRTILSVERDGEPEISSKITHLKLDGKGDDFPGEIESGWFPVVLFAGYQEDHPVRLLVNVVPPGYRYDEVIRIDKSNGPSDIVLVASGHGREWMPESAAGFRHAEKLGLYQLLPEIPDSLQIRLDGQIVRTLLRPPTKIVETIEYRSSRSQVPSIETWCFLDKEVTVRRWQGEQILFYGGVGRSPEEEREQMRLILDSDTERKLHGLSGEELRMAIDEIWKDMDPSPDTPRNEYREAFMKRLSGANRRFGGFHGRPGWKSDRGRIFVTYGEPDDFDADPFPQSGPAWIRWYYHHGAMTVTFYDIHGTGDYVLKN